MIKIKITTVILLLACPFLLFSGRHLNQYWQIFTAPTWKKDDFKIDTYYEYRFFERIPRLRRLQVSERFSWDLSKYLELRMNLTFIAQQPINVKKYIFTERLEFEFNPSVFFPCDFSAKLRNRFEIRKTQHVPKLNYVTRNRLTVTKKIIGHAPVEAFSISDEIFYNYTLRKFTENRLTFFDLRLGITEEIKMSLLGIYRSDAAIGGWDQSLVFATQFDF